MTVEFDLTELYNTIAVLTDKEGWANAQSVFKATATMHGCTMQTVRNFIWRNSEAFDFTYGRLRKKVAKSTNIEQQVQDDQEFQKWLAPRMSLVEECLVFLKGVPVSPTLDNLLVMIANAREELYSYIDGKLDTVVMELRKSYGFEPTTKIGE
jgi:hypothetical protein